MAVTEILNKLKSRLLATECVHLSRTSFAAFLVATGCTTPEKWKVYECMCQALGLDMGGDAEETMTDRYSGKGAAIGGCVSDVDATLAYLRQNECRYAAVKGGAFTQFDNVEAMLNYVNIQAEPSSFALIKYTFLKTRAIVGVLDGHL